MFTIGDGSVQALRTRAAGAILDAERPHIRDGYPMSRGTGRSAGEAAQIAAA